MLDYEAAVEQGVQVIVDDILREFDSEVRRESVSRVCRKCGEQTEIPAPASGLCFLCART